jgi:hypothetical protein
MDTEYTEFFKAKTVAIRGHPCQKKKNLIFNFKSMKKETWKTILQFIVSILTAALTAFGTTSCMGHGPLELL